MTDSQDNTHTPWRQDDVQNAMSGLGMARDRSTATDPRAGRGLEDREILDLYLHDRFARLIVDRPAKDATRRGWEIEVEDSDRTDDSNPFADDLRRLEVRKKFRKAHEWARLRGGAGVMMILDDDGALEEPITGQVRGIEALHVFSRPELVPAQWNDDLQSPEFDEPTHYFLHPQARRSSGVRSAYQDVVHADRIIRFEGLPVPEDSSLDYDRQDWGQPVLEAAWGALKDISAASQAIASLLHETQFGVLKLKDLKTLIAAGKDDPTTGLSARLDAIAEGRSFLKSIVLDSEEEYELRDANFSGALEAYEVAQQNLSSVTRIPLTLLFGQSPQGFSTEDGTGIQNYYDGVRAMQREKYEPALKRVVDRLAEAKGLEDLEYSIKFHDLETPDEKEEAEIRKLYSEADATNIQNGVLDPDEVRTRYEGPGVSQDVVINSESADDKTRAEMLEELDRVMEEGPEIDDGVPDDQGPDEGGGSDGEADRNFNGAQITALKEVIQDVSTGELPESGAIQILKTGFGLSDVEARAFFEDAEEAEPEPEDGEDDQRIEALEQRIAELEESDGGDGDPEDE